MSPAPEKPSPQGIALRLLDGERISTSVLRKEYRIGEGGATRLLERAQEVRTGWMLMRFPRPGARP